MIKQILLEGLLSGGPAQGPRETVVWTDVVTLVQILKDVSTSWQTAATLGGLLWLPSPIPGPTPGPQDLSQVQQQQDLPLSYLANIGSDWQVKGKIALCGFRKGLLQKVTSEQRPECNEGMICKDPGKAEGIGDAKALKLDDVPSSQT